MEITKFQQTILEWYKKHRRELPWRETYDPYHILVSEVMLQQTQVSRVLQKYDEFLNAFPTAYDLAQSDDKTLMRIWSGLGYWRRARFLKETATVITNDYNGQFPTTPSELQKLPGIGPYTAGALACFAFNSTNAFIDTNIRRTYLHFFFPNKTDVSDKEIFDVAQQAVWKDDPREWHYALFDYGATQLKNTQINKRSKHYTKQSTFKGSFRSFRAQAVKHILAQETPVHHDQLHNFLQKQILKENKTYDPNEVINALVRDNLIKKHDSSYSV